MTVESPSAQQSSENGTEKRPLLSIVTIAKDNRMSFLNTMHSLVDQFKVAPHLRDRVQVIVINGSTKGNGIEILMDEYAEFINYGQSKKDRGPYYAMNEGWDQADGEYVTFMNSGDIFGQKDTLQTVVNALTDHPDTDFLYGDCYGAKGYKQATIVCPQQEGAPRSVVYPTSHQAMWYKRDLVGDRRYNTRFKVAGDYAFTMDYLQDVQNPLHIPEALCVMEPSGCSAKHYVRSAYEVFRVRDHLGMPFVENAALCARSVAVHALRHNMPGVFHMLKENFGPAKPNAAAEAVDKREPVKPFIPLAH